MKSKDKTKDQSQNQVMEGYNPGVYRTLSGLFIVLTIVNLAVIIYAFARTGYGLWHAEDALSCIAKIDSNFEDINQSILKIELYPDDKQVVTENIDHVLTYHDNIVKNADAFRKIDLSNIDATLPAQFQAAMDKVDMYYSSISGNLTNVKKGISQSDVLHNSETEMMREHATAALNDLFDKQDEATYLFFCRVGQSFLFVLLFLILTMSAGLYSISRVKKRDLAFALKLQSSQQKTANIRQKAVEIAYTNVVTGLKNRYALDEKLDERMKTEDITVALYNFNNFKSLNENYGRDFADEFVSVVSKKIVAAFGQQAEIYSTEIDELCVVFNKDIPKSKTTGIAHKILNVLSEPVQIQSASVQLTVAGCICRSDIGSFASSSKLFITMDHGMNQAKAMCMEQNKSVLLPLR